MIELHLGDCLEILSTMPEMSVDAIVTDPPYGLSFMGKKWDYDVPDEAVWQECLRVLKPGGHLLCFAGTRTQHRMAVRIEDAGFEIRDMIAWVYGSGFPKSLDVSKAIDKAAGAEREVVGQSNGGLHRGSGSTVGSFTKQHAITAPATDAARQWDGWGTALKPALEPITVARKPLIGTVAENVLRYGTGAINVDGCRVGEFCNTTLSGMQRWNDYRHGHEKYLTEQIVKIANGRFPANFIHDGSDEVVGLFPVTKPSKATQRGSVKIFEQGEGQWIGESTQRGHDDSGGSAARFFYCAKASKADRDEGCEGMEARFAPTMGNGIGGKEHDPETGTPKRNHHPTVKPTDLMRYLCRLITPPGGIVLDPFMGSGSTGKAAVLEGFNFIGIERELEYIEIAKARIHAAIPTDNATVYEQLSLC
jgi:DNA modification methylase